MGLRYLDACVSTSEHTHFIYLPLKKSLMIYYFQVKYTYPGLTSLKATGKGTESGPHVTLIDTCSVLSTVFYCSHGLLGPVSY